MSVVGFRSESLLFDTTRNAHRRRLVFIAGAVLFAGLLLAGILLLRPGSDGGFRWVPLRNPGTPLVVDAYVGRPIMIMDRVMVLVKSVDRAGDFFDTEVKIAGEPRMEISGGVRSRFRDKDITIEMQAADLGQDSVRFNVWSVNH
jgi:hypothetical protein